MPAGTDKHRRIRSFVRREGRITRAQQKALDEYWPAYGIELTQEAIDFDCVFQRHAPLVLDIGTGMGEATVAMASANPRDNYLAVEVHSPGVGSLLRLIHRQGLANVRVMQQDIMEILRRGIPACSVDKVCVFFPDPWPKKRHHKRRLIRGEFLDLLFPCLKDQARIYIATDWEDYAEHILTVFEQHAAFNNLAPGNGFAPRPAWRPQTKFEQRGQNLAHPVFDFVYAKHKL